ncbi:MAG: restriction endonuclease [Bacteroidaceae bacterium]|nr:restriction endonuclease [Bacteroidaceae bacterium]
MNAERLHKDIKAKWNAILAKEQRQQEEKSHKQFERKEVKSLFWNALSLLVRNAKEKAGEWIQKLQKAKKRCEEKQQREQEAKLQKQIERKRTYAKYKKKEKDKCIQFEHDLNSIGVSFTSPKARYYDIYAPEDVDIENLLGLLKEIRKIGSQRICKIRNVRFSIHCYITDSNNEKLIEITEFCSECCSLVFYKSDIGEMIFKKGNITTQVRDYLFCYLGNRKIQQTENIIISIIERGISQAGLLPIRGNTIEEKTSTALMQSRYGIKIPQNIDSFRDNDMLVVDYDLPNKSDLSDVKEYKYIASSKEIRTKTYTESYIAKRYENVLYSIALRSLYEIFYVDKDNEIKAVTFNGFVTQINPATGIRERKCILSLQVDREKFSQINLSQVEPKACFKALKGVSAAKLIDITPITPILTLNRKDKRFVAGKEVSINQGTNLAAMHWEDFEHLVRELFEMEFARNGGEVRVTQASRDGGVDAIIFDPDPLRGGKIVVQAKRYTNTVGVSAVRDLYGTVINEGANTGILITTSDYGHDSYEFAKDKPLKLLNGGHLLALLHKNGRSAHINIEEAKKINDN